MLGGKTEVTEREEFSVPIRASGGSALLDFPDAAGPRYLLSINW